MSHKAGARLVLYGFFLLLSAGICVIAALDVLGLVESGLFEDSESPYVTAGPYLAPLGVAMFGYAFWNA